MSCFVTLKKGYIWLHDDEVFLCSSSRQVADTRVLSSLPDGFKDVMKKKTTISGTSIADILRAGSTYSPQFPHLTSTHNLPFLSPLLCELCPAVWNTLDSYFLLLCASGVWRRVVVNLIADLESSLNQQGHLPNQSTRRQFRHNLSIMGGIRWVPVVGLLGNYY